MAGHYCVIHGTPYFKKGKMKGYAHPIKDADGEDTGEWCNEEEAPEAPQSKSSPQTRSSDTNSSIESQVAVKAIVELVVAGKVNVESLLFHTAENWIMSKLSSWSSMGDAPKTKETKEEPPNDLQKEAIKKLIKEKGYDKQTEAVAALIITITKSKKRLLKELNMIEAGLLITYMQEGKGLKEIESEELPF